MAIGWIIGLVILIIIIVGAVLLYQYAGDFLDDIIPDPDDLLPDPDDLLPFTQVKNIKENNEEESDDLKSK